MFLFLVSCFIFSHSLPLTFFFYLFLYLVYSCPNFHLHFFTYSCTSCSFSQSFSPSLINLSILVFINLLHIPSVFPSVLPSFTSSVLCFYLSFIIHTFTSPFTPPFFRSHDPLLLSTQMSYLHFKRKKGYENNPKGENKRSKEKGEGNYSHSMKTTTRGTLVMSKNGKRGEGREDWLIIGSY